MSFRAVFARRRVVFALIIGSVVGALWGAACSDSPTTPSPPPTPPCTFSLSSASVSLASAGGAVQVSVSTATGCMWTAQSPVSWVTLSTTSHTGAGSVTLTVAANSSLEARSALVTIAGQTVSVTQAAGQPIVCVVSVTPLDVNVPAGGGSGEIAVATGADCPWEAVSHQNWIRLDGTNPRKGAGKLIYIVDPHTGPVGRLGRLAVAGFEVLVHQAAEAASSCTYKVEPTLSQLAWQHTSANMIVTTGEGCTWTVATDTPWLTLTTPASMTGPGMASVTMSPYKELAPREGMVLLRWPTETAGQNVVVRQFGCGYSVNPAIVNVPAAGGRANASVFGATQASFSMIECPWRLAAGASWIGLNTTTGEGLATVSFDVAANTTGQDRCAPVVMHDPDVARISFQVCQAR